MADATDHTRVKALFVEASSLEGDAHDELLARVEAESPELRRQLDRLLDAERDVDGGTFMAAGPVALTPLVDAPPSDPDQGRVIGPYELVRRLGAGGMGTVYMAMRRDEYRQVVAIKLIKRGMDTDEIIDRFRYERQTLAGLVHPDIARLLDGGTEDGLPYFVMEYVDGERIDTWCDRRRLTIRARLELFAIVCDAVAYAHESIVVHRDLKPANILVTGDGQPKLLDFGLAKMLNPTIGMPTLEPTRDEHRFLTLSYASPEQIQGDTIGKPSDVYSLGVLMYELLTGRKPFRLDTVARQEAERIVAFEPPTVPSTAASEPALVTRADGSSERVSPEDVASARQTSPDELVRGLRGDLDTIVQMALRKEPRERYADAGALVADIRRWLADEPVLARRETFAYAAAKFIRRNRVLVALTSIIVLLLAGGLVGTTTAMLYAFEQRDRASAAVAAEIEADVRAEEAARRADDERRRSISKRLAGEVLLERIDDPELNLLLAIEAVELSPTPAAEYALRHSLVHSKPRVVIQGEGGWISRAVFGPGSERVVSVNRDGTARVWVARTGELVSVIEGHTAAINDAQFSPDGREVVTASDDGTVLVSSAATGVPRLTLEDGSDPIVDAAFSPDGRWVVAAGHDGTARVFDATTGAPVRTLVPVEAEVNAVLFSPDGTLIAEGATDRTGHIIDAITGDELALIEGHRGPVRDAAFSPDGARLVTASDDRTARVWETRTGGQLIVLHGHTAPVRTCAFSPDGRWIATAGDDGTVRVWDAATGQLLHVAGGHSADFSPDGQWLVTVGEQHTINVVAWERFAPLSDAVAEARARVNRELTDAERQQYLRELTDAERDEAIQTLLDAEGS